MISHRDDDHSSSPTVADWIKRPTRRLRAGSPVNASLFGLAPRGVCLAAHVTTRAGALLLKSDLKFEISDLRLALAGRTVSPITCVSDLRSQNLSRTGWSVFCCTCRRPNLSSSEISIEI